MVISIYSPHHPNAYSSNYVYLHRLVMEKKLRRYLTNGEVVHHINNNSLDNRLKNLQLMTHKEHIRFHIHKNRRFENAKF